MARAEHKSTCSMKPAHAYYHQTHKKGKWCWLPSEIEELKRQKSTGATFNDISKSFVTNGINRHGTHQCHKKFFQLFRGEVKEE